MYLLDSKSLGGLAAVFLGGLSLMGKIRLKATAFFLLFFFSAFSFREPSFLHAQLTERIPPGEAPASRFPLVDGTPSQVFPKDPAQLGLPADLGTVQDFYQGGSGKFVIYLQDAHCLYEAQSNIRHIIDHFQRELGLPLVALEGGEGKIDPTFFRLFPIAIAWPV